MDLYTACALAEGFAQPSDYVADGTEPADIVIEAWQYLIDTGHVWQLQGWYGRTASSLIEAGVCTPAGGLH